MPTDRSVIDALEATLEKDPENIPIRLHLAELLSAEQEFNESLRHIREALNRDPTNLAALEQAAFVCEKLGDLEKARSYRKLADALKKDLIGEAFPPEPSADGWDEIIDYSEDRSADRFIPLEGRAHDDDFLVDVEYSDIRLDDVAGMETVKRRLNLAFLSPLKNPEMMELYGKSLRGGLMLYGAPGCGKTFIAKAVAGELGARFISVGISDVLDMWIGNSEKNIHSIFENARRNAPCVLFFDEIDALGRKRSLMRTSNIGAVNQLLSELDGMSRSNDGVFVLAATNHPWDVDTALRRPGRFDRTVLVLPPDRQARKAALEYHLRSRPTDASVDVGAIAGMTEEFSGADIAHLVESAAELAMESSLEAGKVRSISQEDFKKALREVHASTRPWFEVAKNYALFANDGGIYDDLIEHLRFLKML